MEKFLKIIWILLIIVIFIIALFIRVYKIGQIPSGFYADEAAIAYNGFSLLQTGKDEYGKDWPLLFRSFGEYKTPTYSYFLIPLFKIWGKSVVVARSLTVVSGLITVVGVMFLTKMWFKSRLLVIISGLVLITMPWHLMFSKTIYEVNLAVSFFIWGLIFLDLKNIQKWNWIIAFCLFSLSLITYNAFRIITPLWILTWIIINCREFFDKINRFWLINSFIVGFLCLYPVWSLILTSGFWERAGINIFSNGGNFYEWLSLYLAYFNPYYLFKLTNSDGKFQFVDLGLLFIWQLPFLLIGIKNLTKENQNTFKYLILLLLISPLPASFTRDPVSPIRSLLMVIPVGLIISLGILKFIEKFNFLGKYFVISLFTISLGRLYLSVFKISDYYNYRNWNYGLEQLAGEINKLPPNIPIIYVGDKLDYIQLAFYLADPKIYLSNNYSVNNSNYYKTAFWPDSRKINNLEVRNIEWTTDIFKKQIIIFGNLGLEDKQIKEHFFRTLFEIKGPDHKRLFIGVQTNPELKLASENK